MPRYPSGIDLIQGGRCPVGAIAPIACMFCQGGHMTECHYPYDCVTAQCGHLAAYDDDPDWEIEELSQPVACEFCGCTETDACPGSCGWSDRYWKQGRLICTGCESMAIAFEINMAALQLWRDGVYGRAD
jgi:hypothetical protein